MPDAPAVDVQINGAPGVLQRHVPVGDGLPELRQPVDDVHRQPDRQHVDAGRPSPIRSRASSRTRSSCTARSTAPQLTLVSEVASAPTNGNIQLAVFNAAQNNEQRRHLRQRAGCRHRDGQSRASSASSTAARRFNLAFPPGTYQIQVDAAGHQDGDLRLGRQRAHAEHRAVVHHVRAWAAARSSTRSVLQSQGSDRRS